MVFYIAYRTAKEHKGKGLISKRLELLGCKRICSSFWEVNERKINDVLEIVGGHQPILLKRTREIRRAAYNDEGKIVDLGSLIIVAYNAERNEGKIKGLLARAPYLKICRSVYAFPYDVSLLRWKNGLFDISNMLRLIKEETRDAKIYSRMVIVNGAYAINILVERAKMRIKHRVKKMIEGCKDLMEEIYQKNVDKRRVTEEERRLYSAFASLRRISIFYERWLGEDFTKETVKLYSVMRKLQLLKENCLSRI